MANCLQSPSSCGLLSINCISPVGKYSTRVHMPKVQSRTALPFHFFSRCLHPRSMESHRSSHMSATFCCFPLHRHNPPSTGFYFMRLQGSTRTLQFMVRCCKCVCLPSAGIFQTGMQELQEAGDALKWQWRTRLKHVMLRKVLLESTFPAYSLRVWSHSQNPFRDHSIYPYLMYYEISWLSRLNHSSISGWRLSLNRAIAKLCAFVQISVYSRIAAKPSKWTSLRWFCSLYSWPKIIWEVHWCHTRGMIFFCGEERKRRWEIQKPVNWVTDGLFIKRSSKT